MIPIQDQLFIRSNVPMDRLIHKRILITGGTGFVGHWLDTLGADGPIIKSLNHEQYEYGKWDYADWDAIIHLANVSPSRVIQAAKRSNCPILFSSSGAVYDKDPGEYALDKLHAETELLESGLDVKIARMFCFAGAHMKNHFALINFIYDALSGKPIRMRGDNVIRSYMYAADLSIWLWQILLNGQRGGIYEVGSLYGVNMFQLANEISLNLGYKVPIVEDRIFPPDPRPVYLPHSNDLERTKDWIGVREYTPFPDAITKTILSYMHVLELGDE
jgi:nucleoside-diphosphate-sugar epimerase